MRALFLILLLALPGSALAQWNNGGYTPPASGGVTVTWPATGQIVVSNGTNSPTSVPYGLTGNSTVLETTSGGAISGVPITGSTGSFTTLTASSAAQLNGGLQLARRTITSGSSDTLTATDVVVNWKSATTAVKAESIPACASGIDGTLYIVKDEQQTAQTYAIQITPASGTIEGVASFSISAKSGSAQIVCDGANTNWTVD